VTDVIIQNLVTFRLGELPNDCIATAARLRNQPGETFQRRNRLFLIGLTRAKAAELGRALLERSGMDPAPREPKQTQL
jgi:hypothetical protein